MKKLIISFIAVSVVLGCTNGYAVRRPSRVVSLNELISKAFISARTRVSSSSRYGCESSDSELNAFRKLSDGYREAKARKRVATLKQVLATAKRKSEKVANGSLCRAYGTLIKNIESAIDEIGTPQRQRIIPIRFDFDAIAAQSQASMANSPSASGRFAAILSDEDNAASLSGNTTSRDNVAGPSDSSITTQWRADNIIADSDKEDIFE